jgi:hypothetical protein
MTDIGHFRAIGKFLDGRSDLPTRLWIAPPTKMDAMILNEEGYYSVLGKSGARMEIPGYSLCMGDRADQERQHNRIDLDAQLPEPLGHRHPGLSQFRRIGRRLRADGQDPRRHRVPGTGEDARSQSCRHAVCRRRPPQRDYSMWMRTGADNSFDNGARAWMTCSPGCSGQRTV